MDLGVPETYVLQHEQTHFAISEIEARRIHEEAKTLLREFRPRGETQDEVFKQLQSKQVSLLRSAMGRGTARDRALDSDTSGKYAPEVQQAWLDKVRAELEF